MNLVSPVRTAALPSPDSPDSEVPVQARSLPVFSTMLPRAVLPALNGSSDLPPPNFELKLIARLADEEKDQEQKLPLITKKIREQKIALTWQEALQIQELTKNNPWKTKELFENLTSLHCYFDFKDRELIHILEQCPNLQKLTLVCCSGITHIDVEKISTLIHLHSLNLSHSHWVSESVLRQFRNLLWLIELKLSYCGTITDIELLEIGRITSLRALDLSECAQITDDGLNHLAPLANLQRLNLSGCDMITNLGLRNLCQLPSLQELEITYCNRNTITYQGILALKKAIPRINIFGLYQ